METNENIQQHKRPIAFTILGWLSMIGGIISVIQAGLAIYTFYLGYTYLSSKSSDLIEAISLPFQALILGIPIILAILYFIEGMGFLKLKKWLPKLLLITLVLGFILQVIAYFDSVLYLINPIGGLFKFFVKDAITIWIGVGIVWYTFKKKNLFVNLKKVFLFFQFTPAPLGKIKTKKIKFSNNNEKISLQKKNKDKKMTSPLYSDHAALSSCLVRIHNTVYEVHSLHFVLTNCSLQSRLHIS